MNKTVVAGRTTLARHLGRAFPATIAVGLLLGQVAPLVQAQSALPVAQAAREHAIAPGPLSPALSQFAGAAGVTLASDPALTEGLRTDGLQGSYGVSEGFDRLLAGSGLRAVAQGGGVYRLERANAAGVTSLAPVNVTANVLTDGVTEGSGSYTQAGPMRSVTGLSLTLRETPQSVSVVTRQQLDDQQMLTLGEVTRYVTGIEAGSSDIERTDVYARGFHVDNYQYDGVPVHHGNDFFGASTFDTTVYDRIEFVRGATGLMTGAGNPGAAINLVRKRASSRTLTGSVALSLGSWRHRRGTVDVSTPLNAEGTIRGRVAGTLDQHDAFLERYHTRNRAFLATVEADLTPNTTVRVGVDHQVKRPTSVDWGGLPMFFSDGSPSVWPRDFNASADWTYWNTTNTTVYAGLEHQFDNGWSLQANLSRLERDFESKLLYLLGQADASTGLGISPFANYARQDFSQNSGSLQVGGPVQLLGREHELVFGVVSSRSNLSFGNHPNTATPMGNIFAWDGNYPEPIWGDYRDLGHDVTRQVGAYGMLRAEITDNLHVIAGARQTRWKATSWTAVREHTELTPYAGVVLDLTPVYSVYASYTDIFQPQNYRDVNGDYLDPVTGKSYEAGLKAAWLEGRLNASLAAFRINQDNVAVLDGDRLIAGTVERAYRGDKGVTSRGFEAEVSGELITGLQVTAGFSRTLARKADGSWLQPSTPNNRWHAFASYRLPGQWQRLTVGGGLQWQGKISHEQTLASGVARREQGAVTLANVMATYQFTPQLSAQVNVNNLFDKEYVDFAGSYITYGKPRNVMLNLRYQF